MAGTTRLSFDELLPSQVPQPDVYARPSMEDYYNPATLVNTPVNPPMDYYQASASPLDTLRTAGNVFNPFSNNSVWGTAYTPETADQLPVYYDFNQLGLPKWANDAFWSEAYRPSNYFTLGTSGLARGGLNAARNVAENTLANIGLEGLNKVLPENVAIPLETVGGLAIAGRAGYKGIRDLTDEGRLATQAAERAGKISGDKASAKESSRLGVIPQAPATVKDYLPVLEVEGYYPPSDSFIISGSYGQGTARPIDVAITLNKDTRTASIDWLGSASGVSQKAQEGSSGNFFKDYGEQFAYELYNLGVKDIYFSPLRETEHRADARIKLFDKWIQRYKNWSDLRNQGIDTIDWDKIPDSRAVYIESNPGGVIPSRLSLKEYQENLRSINRLNLEKPDIKNLSAEYDIDPIDEWAPGAIEDGSSFERIADLPPNPRTDLSREMLQRIGLGDTARYEARQAVRTYFPELTSTGLASLVSDFIGGYTQSIVGNERLSRQEYRAVRDYIRYQTYILGQALMQHSRSGPTSSQEFNRIAQEVVQPFNLEDLLDSPEYHSNW